ncbi:DUF3949 domain-containing protein [Halobacillus salinarum]|uniref:DUF3949 domain-containing protein n=1 Tax=Halobacillus salinarum TaxID=2932257 RepID=A0ABY4ENG8_9BACI|nr:DUF3949 domain-containing protein [Halobacillus salinarum]UOQ45998.1 DUF3949 domain-containing protein [Halobacillus salinarum]
MSIILGAIGMYVLLSCLLVPIQYRYLKAVQKERVEKRQTQNEYYGSMPLQEEILHGNIQGNPLFFLANIMAWILLKRKSRT